MNCIEEVNTVTENIVDSIENHLFRYKIVLSADESYEIFNTINDILDKKANYKNQN